MKRMVGRRLIQLAATLTLIAAGTTVSSSAMAAEFSGTSINTWSYIPTTLAVDGGAVYAVGLAPGVNLFDTDDPMLRNIGSECISWSDIDGTSGGRCVQVDPEGDMWFEDWICDTVIESPPGVIFACTGSAEITGGTGKFAGITGRATYSQYLITVMPDGMLIGYSDCYYEMVW